jgi:hypothetical protein
MKIRTHTPPVTQSFLDLNPNPAPNSMSGGGLGSNAGARTRGALAFTLVETIVASFLAAVMLPSLYASTAAGFAMIKIARENLRATQVLVQRVEAIRLSSYNSAKGFPTNATEYYCASGATNNAGGVAYTVTYNWAPNPPVNPTWGTNMALVTVSASWNSGKVQRSRSMQTYVARYGIQRYVAGY